MLTITISDYFIANHTFILTEDENKSQTIIPILLATSTVYLIALHLINAKDIPFIFMLENWDMSVNNQTLFNELLAVKRKEFTQSLDISYIEKISLNWIFTVFFPITSLYLYRKQKYIILAGFVTIVLLYSVLSTAKSPLLISIFLLFFAYLATLKTQTQKNITIIFILSLMSVTFLSEYRNNQLHSYGENHLLEDDANKQFSPLLTPTDITRIKTSEPPSTIHPSIDYLLYRMIATPADVSVRWYRYFGQAAQSSTNLFDLLPNMRSRETFEHPANTVGKWAYHSRFPEKYPDFIRAYASADADAYSIGGIIGVILLCFAIFAMRVIPLYVIETKFSFICYAIFQGSLAYLFFQASIQAILFSQGSLIILILIVMPNIIRLLARPRNSV